MPSRAQKYFILRFVVKESNLFHRLFHSKRLRSRSDTISETTMVSIKRATSRFAHLENFGLNFSSSLFSIRGNILHLKPPCFIKVSFFIISSIMFYLGQLPYSGFLQFNVTLYVAKIPPLTSCKDLE